MNLPVVGSVLTEHPRGRGIGGTIGGSVNHQARAGRGCWVSGQATIGSAHHDAI